MNRREGDHANGERRETRRRPTPGEKRRMRTGPTPDTRRRRPRADRWRRRGGGRQATLTPRGGKRGGPSPRRKGGRASGQRGGETPTGAPTATPGRAHGFDSTPRRPPWHPGSFPPTHAFPEDGGAGRAPRRRTLSQQAPTDRRGRQPLSLFPLHLAGRLSPRTRLQETRRDAPPRPRRPGRPSNRNFLPPAGRPFPQAPRDRPGARARPAAPP